MFEIIFAKEKGLRAFGAPLSSLYHPDHPFNHPNYTNTLHQILTSRKELPVIRLSSQLHLSCRAKERDKGNRGMKEVGNKDTVQRYELLLLFK